MKEKKKEKQKEGEKGKQQVFRFSHIGRELSAILLHALSTTEFVP